MSKAKTGVVVMAMLGVMATLAVAAGASEWELVGYAGPLRFVYVDPAHMKDASLLAHIVGEVYSKFGKDHAMEIDFFDSRAAVPQNIPFTQEQRRHQKGKFNFNPKTGLQRFVRLDLVPDPNDATKLRIKETEEKLPLP
ncbi:MAG TPA: hypothetical protein VFE84_08335 [Patescibacteria group bacterium]|nr:hypothetical protein [Patescibacteria group bacterium]